jgi:UDPglucose--hexose-1-phosphate uridylyltransferase
LCPGNSRAAGAQNPNYESTFVFENDYAALMPATPTDRMSEGELLIAEGEPGICRVVCFLPRHDLTIARMRVEDIRRVVDVWTEQYVELGSQTNINWVQIFENRGAMMGASNPHPHGQIWSNATLPNEANKENHNQQKYLEQHNACLLCEYLRLESNSTDRIVCENRSFQALVPFWAIWPFETMVISRRHLTGLDELTETERDDLADLLKQLTIRYDNLFRTSFPYTMGFHQRPTDGLTHPEWHFHAHYYPPLLRSATVRKFMVGYELLGTPQRDITPEAAAMRLRGLSAEHYLDNQ